MWSRSSAFLIWAAAAAALLYWVLRLGGASPQPPAHALPASSTVVARGDLARVLGADPSAALTQVSSQAPSTEQARFQLLGVIAAGAAAGARAPAWASISVDGKPARTYRVGSVVDGTSVLQTVAARGVEIGPRGGAPTVTLTLSALPAAQTAKALQPPPPAPGVAGPAGDGQPATFSPGGSPVRPVPEVTLRRPGVSTR